MVPWVGGKVARGAGVLRWDVRVVRFRGLFKSHGWD
jgi:hypothetical protein